MIVDLDPESRRALEWDAVLSLVAEHAASRSGAASVLSIAPSVVPERIEAEHERVAEAARYLNEVGRLAPGGTPDPASGLALLPVAGARLPAQAAFDLATALLAASDLRSHLLSLDPATYPRLRELGAEIADLRAECRPIVRGILPDGRLADDASPELARIRNALFRAGEALRRMLEAWMREPASGAIVQDEFVTQRNGRFVVPVRSEAPRAMRGIVHATSSSGATLFVEPLETVDANNELVRLAEAELEEQERILDGWSNRLRERLPDVVRAISGWAAADSLQARALFAGFLEAVRPTVRVGGPLRLTQVRHPLLDQRLRASGGGAVPSTIQMGLDERVLVLSGPNTGGKTVALKTIGLATLMAQAGIPVCADAAELPLVSQIRADIGDHQSIDADLSTFSAHLRAVSRFLDEAQAPALFLFDEIGSGTDPAEGAALARAVLEHLVRPEFKTVATTHQGALKAWAFSTEGAVSAALEFDHEALRPTFRILMGAAGASAGIDVAARLGLDPALVDRARQHLGGGTVQAEDYMRRLREMSADVERLRDDLARRESALEAETQRLRAQAVADSERRRREASAALEAALREFREESRREIAAIEDPKERARLTRQRAAAEGRLGAEAERKKSELAASGGAELERSEPLTGAPSPGTKVLVYSLGKSGEVVTTRGNRVAVRLGETVFTVALADLRKIPIDRTPSASRFPVSPNSVTSSARKNAPPPRQISTSAQRTGVPTDDLNDSGRELLLIGKRVEEALEELDRRLDDAVRAGWTSMRVVHGHGTGRLRSGVRKFLTTHPHVEAHRPGNDHEGGDGATVVQLK